MWSQVAVFGPRMTGMAKSSRRHTTLGGASLLAPSFVAGGVAFWMEFKGTKTFCTKSSISRDIRCEKTILAYIRSE